MLGDQRVLSRPWQLGPLGASAAKRRGWNNSSSRPLLFQCYHFIKPRFYKQIVLLLPALPVCLISVPSFLRAFEITAGIISINKV